MKKIINLIPLIILVIIVFIGSFAIYKNQKQKSLNDRLESNKIVALPEFSFVDLYDANKILSNKDFDQKLSLLNVFASWCSTCRQEHQLLLRLAATGIINVYGIAWRDIDDDTIRYLEKNGNPYLKIGLDNKGILTDLLNIKGVPESFIINKEGKIIYRHQGNLTEEVIQYIEKLYQSQSTN